VKEEKPKENYFFCKTFGNKKGYLYSELIPDPQTLRPSDKKEKWELN